MVVAVALGMVVGEIALATSDSGSIRIPYRLAEPGDGSGSVTVTRGDHLWKISERHLEASLYRTPTQGELRTYWKTVVEANSTRLRSRNPDLIYPGEVIELPPVPEP